MKGWSYKQMTPEQRKAYERERERAKRKQIRKAKALRQRRQMMILLFAFELLCIFCMLSFLIGKKVGAKSVTEDVKDTIAEQGTRYQDAPGESEIYSLSNKDGDKSILLVNKENELPENYEVELVTLDDGVNRAAVEAYEPLREMLKAGQAEGLVFEICSSYRSVERQQQLFDEDVEALIRAGYSYSDAYEEVAKETMPPGYSEHATGLAFDIVARDYQMLDQKQKDTAENKWLREHCAEYGFILRYPEGKEDITQISYESWHFRYVGVEAATYIMENDLTLEEYLEL